MCEKRTRRLKKGCKKSRLREARRMQRMMHSPAGTPSDNSWSTPAAPVFLDRQAHQRILLEIALRTVSLVQRNKLIQEKLAELRKDTKKFYTNAENTPENDRSHTRHVQIYSDLYRQAQNLQQNHFRPLINCIGFPLHIGPKSR